MDSIVDSSWTFEAGYLVNLRDLSPLINISTDNILLISLVPS
jgi:hypothetical protein